MICSIDSKIFTYCWLLRIAGPHPISEAALGGGLASRTSRLVKLVYIGVGTPSRLYYVL
jgi:hypothetical protein